MIADYETVHCLFITEVELDIEDRFPMLARVDIPMSVTITYNPEQQIWRCTCTMRPSKIYDVVRFRRDYTDEIIKNIKDHYATKRK